MRYYGSPRWTSEITDCSMPLTFDTYSVCSFGCLYCFSFFQKSHTLLGYLRKAVRWVNPNSVERLFVAALKGKDVTEAARQFGPYIRSRIVMQWGGLSDPFDRFEQKYGMTLRLMKFFDAIDYPLSFSTKGTFFTQDERYMRLFARHTHNWHVKISIITLNERKARLVEVGVPSPQERLEAIRRLSRLGVHVTLRLRPFILGISDDFEQLIAEAALAGADSVTTEFLCVEARADKATKNRFAAISRVAGFDVFRFYKENSPFGGYLRLTRALKWPYLVRIKEAAHRHRLGFTCSDVSGRDLVDFTNCCGVPSTWRSFDGHFGYAVFKARETGEVSFETVRAIAEPIIGTVPWRTAVGYNTADADKRARFGDFSFLDWLRYHWNRPWTAKSPTTYGCLVPNGRDDQGDIIYRYDPKAEERRAVCLTKSQGQSS